MIMQRILTDDGIPEGRVDEFREYLSHISSETQRVGRIVSDLLSFSRGSAPNSADVDLNETIRHTLALISHKLELSRVTMRMELSPELPAVRCDPSQIEQVVLNLVMNALLGNLEFAVIGLDVLFRDVLGDDVVRDIAACRDKVASRPQVTSPKRPIERPEVPQKPIRTATLDGVHHSARRHAWRHTQ